MTLINTTISGIKMRVKAGGPEKGHDSQTDVGDVRHAQFLWLSKGQRQRLRKRGVGVGSRVTVRLPSVHNKKYMGTLKNYSRGSGMIDLDHKLGLTRRQAKIVIANKQKRRY